MSRKILPYWFTPTYQANPDLPVEFHLKPLDQGSLHTVQHSMKNGVPSWDGIKESFEKGVIGWKNVVIDGEDIAFGKAKVQQILSQPGSISWMLLLGEVSGQLYNNAFLTDEEKKT